MDHRPKLRADTIKLLEENIGIILHDLELNQDFLDTVPKVPVMKITENIILAQKVYEMCTLQYKVGYFNVKMFYSTSHVQNNNKKTCVCPSFTKHIQVKTFLLQISSAFNPKYVQYVCVVYPKIH